MAPLDQGVWKSGKGKGRHTPKGRQVMDSALVDVKLLLKNHKISRDLLIEFLHLIQDKYGYLSSEHLCALAFEMKLSQTEVYEVATFYAHFDVVKEGEITPPEQSFASGSDLNEVLDRDLKKALEKGTKVIIN